MPMTNDEYLAKGGNHCPFCNSLDITGGHVEVEAGCAWQNISCDDCGFSWQDEYVLTGWTDEFSDNVSEKAWQSTFDVDEGSP